MSQVQDNHLNPTIQGYRHWGGALGASGPSLTWSHNLWGGGGGGGGWGFGGFGAIINLESQLVANTNLLSTM